jgi:hypothetical protein
VSVHHYVSRADKKRQAAERALAESLAPKGKPTDKAATKRPTAFHAPTAAQTYVALQSAKMLHTLDCQHAGEGNHVPASPEQLATLRGCRDCG